MVVGKNSNQDDFWNSAGNDRKKMIINSKKEIISQIDEKQPLLAIVILGWAFPSILLTQLAKLLLFIPYLLELAQKHDAIYANSFFVIQLLGTLFFICYFLRYSSALHTKSSSFKDLNKKLLLMILILLPVLIWHGHNCHRFISTLSEITSAVSQGVIGASEYKVFIHSINTEVWGQLAYGDDLYGMIFSSILSFIAPILEELTFTGFIMNKLSKRFNIIFCILATSTLFMSIHFFQFGIKPQLLVLFWYSATYIFIRLKTGSVYFSIGAHMIVNILIFVPKWGLYILDCRTN